MLIYILGEKGEKGNVGPQGRLIDYLCNSINHGRLCVGYVVYKAVVYIIAGDYSNQKHRLPVTKANGVWERNLREDMSVKTVQNVQIYGEEWRSIQMVAACKRATV